MATAAPSIEDLERTPTSSSEISKRMRSTSISPGAGGRKSAHHLVPPQQSLISKMKDRIDLKHPWFSLEFFPPRTVQGAANLISKFEHLATGGPLFCDITWHPAGDPANDKPTSSMKIANVMLNYCLLETMLHITCLNLTKEKMMTFLNKAKSFGIRNLLALRGDPPVGNGDWEFQPDGFNYAVDLVKFCREHFDDYFVICVAGYPQGHPDSVTYQDDLMRTKEKVDAGADFIITQLFFNADKYIQYVKDLRELGVVCPIIPGILPIQSYDSLRHICKLSKLDVPNDVVSTLETIKDNDEAIRNYGIDSAVVLCKKLLASGTAPGLHFYTLNRDAAVTQILRRLGLWTSVDIAHSARSLPWKQSPVACQQRPNEEVRPIFWSTRPKSYVCRTSDWDQFPNGRWGNSAAPSFGDLKDYHIFYNNNRKGGPNDELTAQWGVELNDERDVWELFAAFLSRSENKSEHKVTMFPWCEGDLALETGIMQKQLCEVNKKGILTINSQPSVNGAPSADKICGWGAPNGYVYQKSYLEFFVAADQVKCLLSSLEPYGSRVNYHIINKSGEINFTNCESDEPNAVTWGVFPGKEIVQPTVVDPISFLSWKDEAFNIWTEKWGSLYESESKSSAIINLISETYVLVNLVDNDFQKENCLFDVLGKIIEAKQDK